MPRHLLALALGVCAGVAVMVVAARGIALSRMLYLLAGLIFAGNLFAALAFDYWSMLAARFIAGLPHGAYFGVGAIVATSLAAPGQASRDVCLMVTGMRRDLSLGDPATKSLTVVKAEADRCRAMVADGIDPIDFRAQVKSESRLKTPTLQEYVDTMMPEVKKLKCWRNPRSADNFTTALRTHVLTKLGKVKLKDIDTRKVKDCLSQLWSTAPQRASFVRSCLEFVFSLAVRDGHMQSNPALWRGNLAAWFPSPSRAAQTDHIAALTLEEMQSFMKETVDNPALGARLAIFGMQTATRSQEFSQMSWKEVDFAEAVWHIPPARRKDGGKVPYPIPLSRQALALLSIMRDAYPGTSYVFPSRGSGDKPVFKYLGSEYLRRVTGKNMHGCRSTFRDWATRSGKDREVAEKWLMHKVGDAVEQAYQRDSLLERRRVLMQQWADAILPMS